MRMHSLNIGFYTTGRQINVIATREMDGFKLSGYCMGSNVNNSRYADDSSS